MIVGKQSQEIVNNLPFASKTFNISANAKAFDMLIVQLYSDPVTAMIREIVANACDSHRSAGINTKVRVVIPNPIEPWFIVEDFGLGMSEETIDTIYTNVFESTKDQDNESTGGFGLGSKTPYAVTDTFNVTSIKDGIKCEYLMYRDGNRNPAYMLTSKVDTDEPNGVKVSVPFNGKYCSYEEFKSKASAVLSRFDFEFECNVDVVNFREKLVSTSDQDIFLEQISGQRGYSHYNKESYVIMAGIAYPVDTAQVGDISVLGHRTYFVIPNGSVELTPSREQLFYSEKTKQFLKSGLKDRTNKVYTEIVDGMDKCITISEKISYYRKWQNFANVCYPSTATLGKRVKESFFYQRSGYNVLEISGSIHVDTWIDILRNKRYVLIERSDHEKMERRVLDRARNAGAIGTGTYVIAVNEEDFRAIHKFLFDEDIDGNLTYTSYDEIVKHYKQILKDLRTSKNNIVNKKSDGHLWILVNGEAQFIQLSDLKDDDLVIIPSETVHARSVTNRMTKYTQGTLINIVQKVFGKRVVYARTVLGRTACDENVQLDDYLKEIRPRLVTMFGAANFSEYCSVGSSYSISKNERILKTPVDDLVKSFDTRLLHKHEYEDLIHMICTMKSSIRLLRHYGYERAQDIGVYDMPDSFKKIMRFIKRAENTKIHNVDGKILDFMLDGDY